MNKQKTVNRNKAKQEKKESIGPNKKKYQGIKQGGKDLEEMDALKIVVYSKDQKNSLVSPMSFTKTYPPLSDGICLERKNRLR